MSASLRLINTNAFIKQLEGIENKVVQKAVPAAARKALRPIVKAAQSKLPGPGESSYYTESGYELNSGNLRKSIGIKRYKPRKKGLFVMAVGPRKKYGWTDKYGVKQDPIRYAVPLEYGHVLKYFGRPTGVFIPPRSFMRSSIQEKRSEVLSIFERELAAAIKRYSAGAK